MKELLKKALAIGGALAVMAASATIAEAKDGKIVIGLAMPFQNNGWQKGVLESATWAVDQLNAAGKKVELKVVDAAGDPQTQMQQINNLTLQGVDYIILEPLSDTALNGAIDNAMDAGIGMIAMATGSVTNTRPIDLQFDYDNLAKGQVEYLAKRTGGKGKALNIRGLAGAQADQAIQDAYKKILKNYPGIEIVADVYGDWNQSTAQQRIAAILPTLPQVDMIFSEGVAAFGAAQAFQGAGRKVPLQVYGLDGVDLNMLRQLNEKEGYESVASNNDPGVGSVAVNVAVAELSGTKVPRKLIAPTPVITIDDLKAKYQHIDDNVTVAGHYDYDWTMKNIIGAK